MNRFSAFFLSWFISTPAVSGDLLTAVFSDGLSTVNVELCFQGPAPYRLFRNAQAQDWSDGIFHAQTRLEARPVDGELRLPRLPANACIQWRANIDAALSRNDRRLIVKMGDDLIMDADIWFWKGPKSRDLTVKVKLPPGTSFSTPWAAIKAEDELLTFRPDKTPASWETRIAVGRFELQNIDIPGAQIRVAMTGNLGDRQKEKFMLWIRESVLTVSSVLGYFPQPQPQVLIIPVGRRNQSTPFGLVTRGGGLAVSLLVDENRPLKDFTSDWTATHEFSHMLFPYVSSRDRWLSEGLASYYQNILRARNGRLTESQAWQKLHEGFQRGENGTNGGTLAQATRDGWQSTMRVYWSGAALMLKADMQLRENSGGRQSLDTALKSLAVCCLENGRTWRARELFTRLDELTGTSIFLDLYNAHVHAEEFPDMQTTWEHLGITIRRDQVSLSDDAPLAAIRTSIMKG